MSLEVVLGELTRARSLAFEAADSLEGVAYVPSTGSEATFGSPVLASAAQAFCLELEDVVRGHAARAEQTAEALGAAAADYARADQEVETQVGALAGGLGTVAPGIGWGASCWLWLLLRNCTGLLLVRLNISFMCREVIRR